MGASGLALFFAAVLVYSLIKSRAKVRTIVWTVVAMVATILVGFVAAALDPVQSALFGAGSVDLSFLTGSLAALVHAGKTARQKVKP